VLIRETVTFRDSAGWNWEFDLTFMRSNYRCIWGRGCPDVRLQGSARGCCVEGVEVHQGEGDMPGSEDLEMIRGRVEQMTDEDWQNRQVALRGAGRDPWAKARFKRDSVHTRVHRGACIFHNRIDHPAGAGCAFHVAALRRGENPIDWKPRICWQVPLFFDIDEKAKTTTVRASRTVDWGEEGRPRLVVHRARGRVQRRSPGVREHGGGAAARVRRRCLRRAGRLLPRASGRPEAARTDATADRSLTHTDGRSTSVDSEELAKAPRA
jgi:hypothetical protein